MRFAAFASRLGLAIALAAPLAAQDRPSFDPTRDLEGFEAAFASEFRELYGLDAFSELLGKELTQAELAAVLERWKAARAAGDARVRELRADPAAQSSWLLLQRLARSSYFSEITLLEDRSFPGFLFLVQRPLKDDPQHAQKLAARHGPWLAKIAELFDAQYAKPLGLQRPHTHALWAFALLATRGDYGNYWRVHPNPCANAWGACYDTKNLLTVGYDDPFQRGGVATEQRYPLLHAAVRQMIFAHATARDRRPWAMWVEEGLASYLAYHEGAAPDCLKERRIRPTTLKAIVGYVEDPALGALVVHPIEVLADLREPETLDRRVNALAEVANEERPHEDDVVAGFYGQSALWVHFLHRARDGALRERFLQYLKWALSANGGPDALRVALGQPDLAALDREFLVWVFEEHRRAFPQIQLDPAAIDAFLARRAALTTAAPADAPEAPEAPDPSAPAVSPALSTAALAIAPDEADLRHGLALLRARTGDLEGAIAALEAVAQAAPAAPHAERVEREIARLRQLALLRDGYLASLVASGAKWTIDHEGKKLVATVRGVEGGRVLLGENRLRVAELPLAGLDLIEIARQASKREQQGKAEPWARPYAYVLFEDERWDKLLKPDSDAAKALREDAATWFGKTLRAGRAAAALDELAARGAPTTAEQGRAAVETIRKLVAESADRPEVQRRMGDLRKLAAAAVEATWDGANPASLLHGTWKELGDGRTSIAWEFDDPAEAGDFVKLPGYLSEWRKVLKLDAGKESEAVWAVEEGAFRGKGAACFRLPFEISAPMTLRYTVTVPEVELEEKSQANFTVGLCDDLKRDQILVVNFGELFVRNGGKQEGDGNDRFPFFLSTEYVFEVRHDGTKVTVTIDGEARDEAPCLGRTSGSVILWFHTTLPVSFGRFEVEGKIDPASAVELRRLRAEESLVDMGFPR